MKTQHSLLINKYNIANLKKVGYVVYNPTSTIQICCLMSLRMTLP